MLGRNLVRVLFGLMLLSNAANLVIFASGRTVWGRPPFVPEAGAVPPETVANALPQALILTALVIGFGLLAFVMVLIWRGNQELGTIDTDVMCAAEPPPEAAVPGPQAPAGERREEAA